MKDSIVATQIGLHSIKNLLGQEQQLSLFSQDGPLEFAKDYGVHLEGEITKFGIELTDVQLRVMESILYGFSKTKYEGNIEPQDREQHAKEKYASGKLPSTYKYIKHFPRLRVTLAEILEWAGVNKNSPGDIQAAIEAIRHLGVSQYCFYYTRLALDESGLPVKDKEGYWKKEEVQAVDTLFTVKMIRDEKTQNLQYYEITPSALFLDQRESYFMLIPNNWREEVRKLIGQKKASSYTFRFLLFLRYQFELKRRSPAEKKPYYIKWSPEAIATAIKMPEIVYRRNKKRAQKILDDVYLIARQLGYLTSYERTGTADILHLNESKYYSPRAQEAIIYNEEENENYPEMKQAQELYELFITEKRKIDPKYSPVMGGHVKRFSLNHLVALIKERTFDDVKSVILWGINQPYWCNRIGTPAKLRKYFHEAISQMNASKKDNSTTNEDREKKNKTFVLDAITKLIQRKGSKIKIEALNKYVEIGDGVHQPTCINYAEKGFEEQFEGALRKWKLK